MKKEGGSWRIAGKRAIFGEMTIAGSFARNRKRERDANFSINRKTAREQDRVLNFAG